MTDVAMGQLSDTLGVLIGSGAFRSRDDTPRHRVVQKEPHVLPGITREIVDESAVLPSFQQAPALLERDGEQHVFEEIFRFDGKRLRLELTDLKANSRLDCARRLTYLFLAAWEQREQEQIGRADLYGCLTEAALLDNNARTFIGKSGDLVVENDMVGLKIPGRQKAHRILAEVFDPSIQGTWSIGAASRPRTAKSSKSDDVSPDGTTKPARRRTTGESKKVNNWVTAWKALGRTVLNPSALQDRSATDKGIFGLWAIRLAAGDSGKVVSRLHLAKFLYQVFEIQVDDRHLERVLKAAGKGKVLNVSGTNFQIPPTGIEYAEEMAKAIVAPQPATTNGTAKG